MAKKTAIPLLGIPPEDKTISSYLPYFFYYEDGGFFYNIDGSISVMYEVMPPNKIVDKAQEEVLNGLVTFLNHYYKDTVIQLLLNINRGVPAYAPIIQRFLSAKKKNNLPKIVKSCIEQKIRAFGEKKLFRDDVGDYFYSAKSIGRLFTITILPQKPNMSGGIINSLFGDQKKIKDDVMKYADKQVEKLNNIIKIAMDAFGIVGIKSKKVDAERFLDILYPVLNAGKFRVIRGYDKLIPLREQLCNTPITVDGSRITIGDKRFCIAFVNSVSYTNTNLFFNEDSNGLALTDLLGNFLMTMSIYNNNIENEMLLLSFKRRLSLSLSRKKGNEKDVVADNLKNELDDVIKDISSNGKVLSNATISFLVEEDESDRLINTLNLKGINCFKEDDPMTFPMFLESLPFFYRKEHEMVLQRSRKMYPENVADMMPLYPEFRGTDTGENATHIYLDRRGNPVTIDLFKSTTSAHTVVLGATGSGKSFFMNDFILQANRGECQILVIDKGNSYKRNCKIFGGKYIVLNPNNPVTMNPFYEFNPNDKDKLIFISSLLTFMAVGMNESKDYLTREKRGVLEQAITDIGIKITDREITLSDFIEFVKGYGDIGKELSRRIFPFTKNGRYGSFFDGENQFSIDNPFTVFEIGNVNDDELLTAWFMTTAYFYAEKIQSNEMLGISKYLIMDEVWRLMSMESTIGFFLEIVKTYRKYGASLITITQDFEDFFTQRSGVAIFNNSPIKLLLTNSTNAIMSNKDKLLLTDWELKQYLSLKKTKNYSEIFAKLGDETSGVVRLTATPQIYWMSTTNDKDKRIIENYKERYGSLELALENLSKNNFERQGVEDEK